MLLGASGRLAEKFISAAPPDYEIIKIARGGRVGGQVVRVTSYDDIPSFAYNDIDCIVNCAGVARGSPAELDKANHLLPARVARTALAHGVQHFVQVSSFSIFGKASTIGASTPVSPANAYGISKGDAEKALIALQEQGLKPALVRVPIIYDHRPRTKVMMLARLMSRLGWFIEPDPVPNRAMIHAENCAALLHHVVRNRLSGAIFGADLESFEINLLADALRQNGRRISITRVPAGFLAPLGLIAPGFHSSLFCSSSLRHDDNACLSIALPKTLRDGLNEIARNC